MALCLLLGALCACGGDQIYVYLEGDVPPDLRSLEVELLAGGGRETREIKDASTSFTLRTTLPGDLELRIRLRDGSGCTLASGRASTALRWGMPQVVRVPVSQLPEGPTCRVAVFPSGVGWVRSSPPGIDCGEDMEAHAACDHEFPRGKTVTLEPSARFLIRWSGVCAGAGAGDCRLPQGESVVLEAPFSPGLCTSEGLCRYGAVPPPVALRGMWGRPDQGEVWAVGNGALILRRDAQHGWIQVPPPSGETRDLLAVAGSAADVAWAVGRAGAVLRWSGSQWERQAVPTTMDLNAVWVSRTGAEAWAVGAGGIILRWDGSAWRDAGSVGWTLNAVYSPPDQDGRTLWIGGAGGGLWRLRGMGFTQVDSGTGSTLRAISGPHVRALHAVGDGGVVLRYRPESDDWVRVRAGGRVLYALSGRAGDDLWAVGESGTVLHYDGRGWFELPGVPSYDLYSAWSTADSSLWMGASRGALLRLGPEGMQVEAPIGTLRGVNGDQTGALWAVGDDGVVMRGVAGRWQRETRVPPGLGRLHRVCTDGQGAWIVGDAGVVLRCQENGCIDASPAGAGVALRGCSVGGAAGIWVVGDQGYAARFTDGMWQRVSTGTTRALHDISAGIEGQAETPWAVGEQGGVLQLRDGVFRAVPEVPTQGRDLYRVFGDKDAIWIVGARGLVLRGAGGGWSAMHGAEGQGSEYDLLDGFSAQGQVWAVGKSGAILSSQTGWALLRNGSASGPAGPDLRGVWGTASGGIWAVGAEGTIMRYRRSTGSSP
jgi:hypothetical protein